MEPCASINAFYDATFKVSVETQMQRMVDGGFRHLDMNFWDWSHDEASPFEKPDWRDWVKGIGEAAQRMGVVFTQAHAHVYNIYAQDTDAPHEEQIRRSIEGAGMLNIPWIVLHPSQRPDYELPGSHEKMIAENAEYFRRHAERAAKWGVGLALENMRIPKNGLDTAEKLCELIDRVDMPNVGACWDMGHANLAGVDQAASLRFIGKRLHAVHIADNDGRTDLYTIPYNGTIEWAPIIAVLKEIGYDGDFTFEAHNFVRHMPESCKAAAVRLMYEIGRNACDQRGK